MRFVGDEAAGVDEAAADEGEFEGGEGTAPEGLSQGAVSGLYDCAEADNKWQLKGKVKL